MWLLNVESLSTKLLVAKMSKLKITLVKSLIGRKQAHIDTAKALGLTKINKTRVVELNPAMRGMIDKIRYLLQVEETK